MLKYILVWGNLIAKRVLIMREGDLVQMKLDVTGVLSEDSPSYRRKYPRPLYTLH